MYLQNQVSSAEFVTVWGCIGFCCVQLSFIPKIAYLFVVYLFCIHFLLSFCKAPCLGQLICDFCKNKGGHRVLSDARSFHCNALLYLLCYSASLLLLEWSGQLQSSGQRYLMLMSQQLSFHFNACSSAWKGFAFFHLKLNINYREKNNMLKISFLWFSTRKNLQTAFMFIFHNIGTIVWRR